MFLTFAHQRVHDGEWTGLFYNEVKPHVIFTVADFFHQNFIVVMELLVHSIDHLKSLYLAAFGLFKLITNLKILEQADF